MKPEKRNIVVDLDGTLSETLIPNDALVDLKEKSRLAKQVKPYLKARGILRLLQQRFKIFIVTGRSEALRGITEEWLRKWEFCYDDLLMMKDQWQHIQEYYDFKLEIVRTLNPAFVIEDDLTLIDMLLQLWVLVYRIESEEDWNQSKFEFGMKLHYNYLSMLNKGGI